MSIRNSVAAGRAHRRRDTISREKSQGNVIRSESTKMSVYLLKKNVSLRFEKIKQIFSKIFHGKELSRATHAEKIINIKKQISDEKNYLRKIREKTSDGDTSFTTREQNELRRGESHQTHNTPRHSQETTTHARNSNNRNFIVPPQEIIFAQAQPMTPMQQSGFMPPQQFTISQAATMAPTIPAYVTLTTLPPQSYFEQGWYQPAPSPASSSQMSIKDATEGRTAGRRHPASQSPETSSRLVRQNCRMGNFPDKAKFYVQLQAEVSRKLADLKHWQPSQILHALSHVTYSDKVPSHSNEKMRDAVFELINTIEQMRLDYVPNANDGSPNHYKVIFNNLLRMELVERLPEDLRSDFELADGKYISSGDFQMLIDEYTKLIEKATEKLSGSERMAKKAPQAGQLTSEWVARMNESLAPMREKIEEWSNLEKYQALHHMMNTRILDSITNPTVIRWVSEIEQIRILEVHDADNFKNRNEQKIFFNNNIRSVIKNNLPEDFQKKYDTELEKFNRFDNASQIKEYKNFRDAVLAIIENDMKKLQPG